MAGLAAAAVPLALLAVGTSSAEAYTPAGSVYEIFTEPSLTTDPANRITKGWWGHETNPGDNSAVGDTGPNPTNFSAPEIADGGAAFAAAFNGDDGSHVGIAFVPTSADGSAERPVVTAGELVGQAFPLWSDLGAFGSEVWSPQNQGVDGLWSQAGKDAWVADGKPTLGFDANLVLHTPLRPGNPVASSQFQKSMLNAWPAGTNVSLVYYLFDSINANFEPVLHVGADGRAVTAWMPFTTVASTTDPTLKTSAGYVVSPGPAVATTTTLTPSPASTQQQGQPVQLTAHVAPASGTDPASGSVEFFDGTTSLGSQAVNASGDAVLTTSFATVGTHSLTAKFVHSGNFGDSTSAAVTYSITATPKTSTTTAVSATPSTTYAFDPVDLVATISPAAATGTVQFKDGAQNVGTPVTVTGGTAQLTTSALGEGAHNITAVFTAAAAGSYADSVSPAAPSFTLVAKPVGDTEVGNIDAVVEAGTLTIDTPYTGVDAAHVLHVGTLALNTTNTLLTGSAPFNDIVVTDTRAGALPWKVQAKASNLTSGANEINGQNVGLTGLAVTSNTGADNITATDVPAANGVASGDGGTLGLGGSPKTILASLAGPGTATYHGVLTINAPTTTKAGTYAGTVTFTVS